MRYLENKYPLQSAAPESRLWDTSLTTYPPPRDKLARYVPRDSPAEFYARVPAQWLPRDLAQARREWADACLNSRIMRLEGRIIRFFSGDNQPTPGHPLLIPGAKLVGGALTVVHPPDAQGSLIAQWHNPPEVVHFFEVIARWGYPWRLMDGGRHETPVRFEGDDALVGFTAAHDYAIGNDDGKLLPKWAERAHRAYARFILHEGVQELHRRAENRDAQAKEST
ncbi:hypothetical protein FISHEDRAFT_40707 [Fistulina hepatica ATCC 64428]|uniref:Uncharacterized protein n=1 Tax=Fistulina hepatica ATCC 64428 TaxID=1128425 RepID=A0A0D7AEP3_9AGAR|nr:hypothetical protein FISHEDRAFT_40707 [Fistulina hepatica ATCC 64428]